MSADLTIDGPVAVVTLDSSGGLNIFDRATLTELRNRLQEAAADASVRAVVLTGAGERALSAGADIKYMNGLDASGAADWARLGHEVGRLLETMPKVTIAAINGLAFGGGCELALACDLRYASSQATIGEPEISLGLVPGWGGTQRLARVVGLGFAKELILTGRAVAAEEAHRRGLVDGIHDPVLQKALEVARSVAARSTAAIRAAKELSNASLQGDYHAGLEAEVARFGELFDGADAREGLRAFVEKRPPSFESRS